MMVAGDNPPRHPLPRCRGEPGALCALRAAEVIVVLGRAVGSRPQPRRYLAGRPRRRPERHLSLIGPRGQGHGAALGHRDSAVGATGRASRRGDVTIIMVMQETLPLAEIKAHLSEIVDRIEHEHDRVVLTRNGRAAAVIMSPDDLEALEDTLALLSDPTALEEIDRARKDVARGKVITAEELRAKYLRR